MRLWLLGAEALDDGAEPTFAAMLSRCARARSSIELHVFVWRNDEIGNAVGAALLAAAERGVRVRIRKDLDAALYERNEMNRKPFLPHPLSWSVRLGLRFRRLAFTDSHRPDERDDRLGRRFMRHPNVELLWVRHTHTKYAIFDEEVMLLGSINLEDRHRGYHDHVVCLEGAEEIARFRLRQRLELPHDPARPMDFLLNKARPSSPPAMEIRPYMLTAMARARQSLYVEMAYLGDPLIQQALVAAARRGVQVTFLLSRRANVANDLNFHSMTRLLRQAPFEVVFACKMVHSKLLLVDGREAILGSANMSVFSLQKAEELDLVVRDAPEFFVALQDIVQGRLAAGERVTSPDAVSRYSRVLAWLQQGHQLRSRGLA